jgi:transcriptional regulator PpsR
MKHSAEQMHTPFVTLREMASRLDGSAVGELLARASDVVLTLDAEGVVRDAVSSSGSHDRAGVDDWIGRPFDSLVTVESKAKAARLLDEARRAGAAGPRHMNHALSVDEDLPVSYSAHRAGPGGELILFGRDLSDVAGMQRRLIAAQQAMEREYERQRQLDARYRHLFRTAREAVIVLDAATGRVREANPPAGALFGREPARLSGQRLVRLFEREDAPELEAALNACC